MTTKELIDNHGTAIMQIVVDSIVNGFNEGHPLPIVLNDQPEPLREGGACFVSVLKDGELRGCIGTILANKSLADDISANAFYAAFKDPRFPPLSVEEIRSAKIILMASILSPLEKLPCNGDAELEAKVRPGIDGVLFVDDEGSAVFIPDVWNEIPDKRKFIDSLKMKAGLGKDHWSPSTEIYVFTTEKVMCDWPSNA